MLDLFKSRMANQGTNQTQAYLKHADSVVDNTFKRDPAYREVYVTHAPSGMYQVKYDAKFFINARRSISGDSEDYSLQFRPNVQVPVGSYIDIPGDNGELQRWLIIIKDDQPQFSTYYVLKCNWVLKWKIGDKIFKCECVQRTQSSYNSGLWHDYQFTIPENQTIMLLPTTPYVQMIVYDQRMLINDAGRAIPLAWRVSKIMDTIPVGITRLTFAQEQTSLPEDCGKFGIANLCPHKEHNGIKSDLCTYCTLSEPAYIDAGLEMPVAESLKGRISYSGQQNIRVGGSAKALTAEYWDDINKEFLPYNAYWTIKFLNYALDVHYDGAKWNVDQETHDFALEIAGMGLADFMTDSTIDHVKLAAEGMDVKYIVGGKIIGHIKLAIDGHALKLHCGQLYSMVGNRITILAEDSSGLNDATVDMEVIS